MSEEDKQRESIEDQPVTEDSLPNPPATSSPDAAESGNDLPEADIFPVSDATSEQATPTAEDLGDAVAPSEEATDGSAAASSEAHPAETTQIAQQVDTLQQQLEERTTQYMRIAADFENYRKRTTREKGELEQRVKRETISALLPVIDSFERARAQIKPQSDPEIAIQKSYQGVYKQLVDCLKRTGVAPMRAVGKEFDPNLHEAVMRQPTDEFEEGIVMEELVNGYMLGDLVLRHAMVKVAAPPEPDAAEDETAETNGA